MLHMEDRLLEMKQPAKVSRFSRGRTATLTLWQAHHLDRVPANPGKKEMGGKDSLRDKKKGLRKERRGKRASLKKKRRGSLVV